MFEQVLSGEKQWEVVCGDCLDVMAEMPDGCVDAVITDPPYGINVADWDGAVPYDLLPKFLTMTSGPIAWFGAASQVGRVFEKKGGV